jgi:predicted nucleotidyltransferase component of viral defense system
MVLSYGEQDINIKIDVSRKIWKSNQYEIMNFYGTDIRIQDRSTLFANKLVALTERDTNRDIYDVWFFFKNMFPLSEAIIRERTGKTRYDFLKEVEQKLSLLLKNYNILDGLGEVLTDKQKYFVKERLISELIGIISFYLDDERV